MFVSGNTVTISDAAKILTQIDIERAELDKESMSLTEGKVYECLYGLEDGIFEDRPFVSVIGDNGKEVGAHASRFELVKE